MAEPTSPSSSPFDTNPWEASGDGRQGILQLFESLRGKLILFFEVRHCIDPEELAEATLERVIQRLCEGTRIADLVCYSFGVAKNIYREYIRATKARDSFIAQQKYRSKEFLSDENEADAHEKQLTCLEGCMMRLKEQDRVMLVEYYKFKGQLKLEHRRQMAEQLGITREALTLRIFHLKLRLKKCVGNCVADK